MAKFAVLLQRTASTTQSVGAVTSNASTPHRGKIYSANFGSEASPADNPFLWQLQRCTTAGTSTAVTPQAKDPADAAALFAAGKNHSVEPTYTANAFVLTVPLNQRATFRWIAWTPDDQITYPATANNGIGVITPTSSAVAATCELDVDEQ